MIVELNLLVLQLLILVQVPIDKRLEWVRGKEEARGTRGGGEEREDDEQGYHEITNPSE